MQIRYPAPLSKGAAFCLCIVNIRNKTLCVLAFVLDSGSALAVARWSGMTKSLGPRYNQSWSGFFGCQKKFPTKCDEHHITSHHIIMRGQMHLFSMEKVTIQVTTPVTFGFRVTAMKGGRVLKTYETSAMFELPQVFTETPVSVKLGPEGLSFTITVKNGRRVLKTFKFERKNSCPEETELIEVSVIKRIPG